MKRFLQFAALIIFSSSLYAQNAALPVQLCTENGVQSVTSGLKSTNYLQGVVPFCTVTVYLTGTQNLATIYKDGSGTPLGNPFVASASGYFLAFAAINQGYDIKLSGGIYPNTYLSPITITGVYPSQQVLAANITNQANGVVPLGCTASSLCAQSHINENTPGYETFTQTISAQGITNSSGYTQSGSSTNTLTGPLNSTYAGTNTFSGTVAAGAIVVGSKPNISAPDAYGATVGNLRDAAAHSIKEWGAKGDGSTDDYTAINNALTWEASNAGSCLYFPAGVYIINTPLTWTSSNQLCILGESHQSTAIYYTGPSGADSALYVNVCPVSGQTCSNGFSRLRIENIGIAATSTNASYAFHGYQVGYGNMTNVAFSGGTSSSFEGNFWNGQQALTNLVLSPVGLPASIPFSCVNGLTFDQGVYNAGATIYPSNQFALVMPTVEDCTGIGLNFADADAVTVTDAQISSNEQNLYDNCSSAGCNGSGNTFEQPLLESTTAVDQTTQPSQFFGLLEGNQINTYGNAIFVNSQILKLNSVSGAGPVVKNSRLNTITDTSTDGIQLGRNTYITGGKSVREQKSIYLSHSGGCIQTTIQSSYAFDGDGNGTIIFSTVPTQLTGGGWRAFVRGSVNEGSTNLNGVGELTELTNANPTITFSNGGTLTLTPSSTGLAWVASGVTAIYGVLYVDFFPGTNCAYYQPQYGAVYTSPISIGAGSLEGGNPILTSLIAGTPTFTAGTNVSSVACASGYTCSNSQGELTIAGGTATTGTIATVNFSTTLSAAPTLCVVTQNGGATTFNVGHGTPSTSSFTITAGVSVSGATVTADYRCTLN